MSLGWTVLIIWPMGCFILAAIAVAVDDNWDDEELQLTLFAVAVWPFVLCVVVGTSPLWLGFLMGRWIRKAIRRRAARKSQA